MNAEQKEVIGRLRASIKFNSKTGIGIYLSVSDLRILLSAVEENEWIDVKEKRPEKGERVLCDTIYGIQIGWIGIKDDWHFSNGGTQLSLRHWQPLPTPRTKS